MTGNCNSAEYAKGKCMERITSIANSKVREAALYSTRVKERRKADVYIAEGRKMFLEAPAEDICRVFVSDSLWEEDEGTEELRERLKVLEQKNSVPVCNVTDEVFRRISDTQSPQGILCVLRQKHYTMEQLLVEKNPLLLVVEDLQDPGNLGTIVRTGEGAGIGGIIMGGDTVDIYNPKTIRATMGSIYRVPFIYIDDLTETTGILKQRGIRCYAADLDGQEFYDGFDYQGGTAFFIGNEGKGLKKETAALADSLLKIPMQGKVESLNAAVAAAVLMYEANRQRSKDGGRK